MSNPTFPVDQRRCMAAACLALACVALVSLTGCSSDLHLSFLDPQGPIASKPLFLWRYRYGAKSARYTPKWNYNGWVEIASWGGPVVIVMVIAVVVWRDTHALDPYKPLASDQAPLRVQVIGYDWKWLFIYPEQGIATVGMLAMPVGRPLAFEITSATVMQSLFIPALGSQIYAMGGMVTQLHLLADRPGRSLGENTMYSGDGFHQQKFTAVAMAPHDFEAWVGKVRTDGVELNGPSLKAIAQRGTRAELAAALSQDKSSDGVVYFSGAGTALFPAVVKATKDGTAVSLANGVPEPASAAAEVVHPSAAPAAKEKTP